MICLILFEADQGLSSVRISFREFRVFRCLIKPRNFLLLQFLCDVIVEKEIVIIIIVLVTSFYCALPLLGRKTDKIMNLYIFAKMF